MSEAVLSVNNLSKRFRSHWTFRPIEAVSSISLEVFRGECFGFLGPNGAGKTTTIKCITGLLRPSGGSITYDGEKSTAARVRALLGYLPEQPYFYDHLSVEETMMFFASLHGLRGKAQLVRVCEVLERVGLEDRRRASVRSLSKGLQQRLGLAQAIVNKPKLLLLDEPFSGLDPLGRVEVRELLLELRQSGTTIFLSSHILSDIADLCDRVAIMAEGKLQTVLKLVDIPKIFGQEYEIGIIQQEIGKELPLSLAEESVAQKSDFSADGKTMIFSFSDYSTASAALSQALQSGLKVVSFRAAPKSLEEIFLKVTEEAAKTESVV